MMFIEKRIEIRIDKFVRMKVIIITHITQEDPAVQNFYKNIIKILIFLIFSLFFNENKEKIRKISIVSELKRKILFQNIKKYFYELM